MPDDSKNSSLLRPGGVTFIAIINALGCLITLIFWLGLLFADLMSSPGDLTQLTERINAATTRGFMIADLFYSVPLLLMAVLGLWRLRPWGWTAAQMVNALWIFSMTVVWIRDAYSKLSPGGILFVPFTLIAVWAIWYLWQQRHLFWRLQPEK